MRHSCKLSLNVKHASISGMKVTWKLDGDCVSSTGVTLLDEVKLTLQQQKRKQKQKERKKSLHYSCRWASAWPCEQRLFFHISLQETSGTGKTCTVTDCSTLVWRTALRCVWGRSPCLPRCPGQYQGWRGCSVDRASDSRSKDPRFEPHQEHKKNLWEFFQDSLSVCPTPLCVYARTRMFV